MVGDLPAGDGGRADHLAGGVVEPVEPDEKHVGQVGRHPTGRPGRPHQLLHEERVALGPGDDVEHVGLGHRVGVQQPHEPAYVRGGEGVELETLDVAQADPLGDLATERVAAVEVVGAVGHDEVRPVSRTAG